MNTQKSMPTSILLLLVFAWLIFIGLSLVATSFLVNAVMSIVHPNVVPNLWQEANLRSLYETDLVYFSLLTFFVASAVTLKAILFYKVISFLQDKKTDLNRPFQQNLHLFLTTLATLSLFIGLLCAISEKLSLYLAQIGISMPSSKDLHVDGADVWIFMAIVLYAITAMAKKAILLQNENDLTI
jgi:hypothetical protein